MPHQPAPPSTALAHLQPAGGNIPHHLWPQVIRLSAPNPGLMTGPGTNSYLVGSASAGFWVIDPGPADPQHVARLWQTVAQACAPGVARWRGIVCTHSHPDHAPAAPLLQARCRQDGADAPPIYGLPSARTANAASRFTPDYAPAHGSALAPLPCVDGQPAITLLALHTPGHAANHLCLLAPELGLLFSGDHILNGSTTVIDPPDGNMQDYLNSLDTLRDACLRHAIHHILPAHGAAMPQPLAVIDQLKAHRLRREARIAAAMQAQPDAALDQWLALAYSDVDPGLWPIAKRSLLAHVARIQSLRAPSPLAPPHQT